jgi:hypothetical protein
MQYIVDLLWLVISQHVSGTTVPIFRTASGTACDRPRGIAPCETVCSGWLLGRLVHCGEDVVLRAHTTGPEYAAKHRQRT